LSDFWENNDDWTFLGKQTMIDQFWEKLISIERFLKKLTTIEWFWEKLTMIKQF